MSQTPIPGPIRVAVVDIAAPFQDLACVRAVPPPYAAAWILACHSGRPLGVVEIPLKSPRISAAELEQALRLRFDLDRQDDPSEGDALSDDVKLPRASVVVPTSASRLPELDRCMQCLAALDYPDYEVIVVDNRPSGSPPLDLPGVRVVREPRPGISAARNSGLAEATGDIIAFTDDDVEVDRRWLRALGERFVHETDVTAVTGFVMPRELETPAQIWFERSGNGLDRSFEPLIFEAAGRFRIRRRQIEDGETRVFSMYATGELGLGANMAFRAAALRDVEGFDESLGVGTPTAGGEDLAMFLELLTAGQRLAYEPAAIVYHTHRRTLTDLEHQLHGYGIGLTAMLTAITLRNPRHVVGLVAVLPAWLISRLRPNSTRRTRRGPGYPAGLVRTELRGMLRGPAAYLRSRLIQRQWSP